jgi:DNA replication protein DnaC
MGESLKSIIDATRIATEAAKAAEAASMGVTSAELEDEQRAQKEIATRSGAIVGSGILIAGDDVAAIASKHHRQTKALVSVAAWSERKTAKFLFLCGGVGTGKTFAAACAIASLGGGTAVRSANLTRRIHPTYADTVAGYEKLNLRNALVVLDDLGTERDHAGAKWGDAFAEFVEQRVMFGRTIITTNLKWDEISRRYGDRIADRLRAHSIAVELTGKSMR